MRVSKMHNLCSVIEEALVCERAKGILAVLFEAGFPSLEEEEVGSPHEATVFVRPGTSHDYNLEVVVRIEAKWQTDGAIVPQGRDAWCWKRVCHRLRICGSWDTLGKEEHRGRIPFIINVRNTDYEVERAVPIPVADQDDPERVAEHLRKRFYRAAGWASVEQSRKVSAL